MGSSGAINTAIQNWLSHTGKMSKNAPGLIFIIFSYHQSGLGCDRREIFKINANDPCIPYFVLENVTVKVNTNRCLAMNPIT